jgi:hypothetical protein
VPLARIRRTPDGRTIVEMPPAKAKGALLALFGLALFAALAAVAIPAIAVRILLGLCAVFFLAMFVAGLPNLFRRGDVPVLTISHDGLSTPKSGLIPWTEIGAIGQTKLMGGRAVGIWTKDPYYAARHGPWYFWPFALFNRATHEPPMSFTARAVPVDDLIEELGRYWQDSDGAVARAGPQARD